MKEFLVRNGNSTLRSLPRSCFLIGNYCCGKKVNCVIMIPLYGIRLGIKMGEASQGMWTVIYIAPTARVAAMIKSKLMEEGFLVECRPINMSKQQFEVLVPSGELEEVQEALNLILHP